MNERQKPLGWKVVAEYQAYPIADDSDDKKRVNNAQNKAENKDKQQNAQLTQKNDYLRPHKNKKGNFRSPMVKS